MSLPKELCLPKVLESLILDYKASIELNERIAQINLTIARVGGDTYQEVQSTWQDMWDEWVLTENTRARMPHKYGVHGTEHIDCANWHFRGKFVKRCT